MQKFNAESILALRDEPLRRDKFNGKENQRGNLIFNDQSNTSSEGNFLGSWKENTKKKLRRTVLRREAEKSAPKNDDLLWDPSFISISSLLQVNSTAPKPKNETIIEEQATESNKMNQTSSFSPSRVSLDFVDEVVEICMILNRRPVKATSIERFSRLESRSDFKFSALSNVNYPKEGSLCVKVTSSLALAAQSLLNMALTLNDDIENLRNLNAVLLSTQILIKAVMEIKSENLDHTKMVQIELLSKFAQICLDYIKNDKSCNKDEQFCSTKSKIYEEIIKLQEIVQAISK